MQNGRPQDSSCGSGPKTGWAEIEPLLLLLSDAEEGCIVIAGGVSGRGEPSTEGAAAAGLTISWLALSSLASALSVSPCLAQDTKKLTPSLDLKEMVGLVSSPNEIKNILHFM